MALLIQPLVFTFQLTEHYKMPSFAGSLFRGIFGHALKATCCMTQASTCFNCPIKEFCVYPKFFEPRGEVFQIQNNETIPPYIINPKQIQTHHKKGAFIQVEMILIGEFAIKHLSAVIAAWRNIIHYPLTQTNELKPKARLKFDSMQWLNEQRLPIGMFKNGENIPNLTGFIPQKGSFNAPLSLSLMTPLRLRENKLYLNVEQFKAASLLKSLNRRASLLEKTYGISNETDENTQFYDFEDWKKTLNSLSFNGKLRWMELQRYSNRQHKHIELSGLVGRILLTGNLSPFSEVLTLLPWINVGKNASFGLGRIEVNRF